VTTVIEHTHGSPVRCAADLDEKRHYLRGRSLVDFGLAAHAWPEGPDEVASLWEAGVSFLEASVTRIPQNMVEVTDEKIARNLLKLLENLEEHEDVQNVYANFDIDDDLMEQLS
jgi:hypothetical protein